MQQQIPHIDPAAFEHATLPEIEFHRAMLGISYVELCREAGLDLGSYRRWRKWMAGAEGGGAPKRSSLIAVRTGMRKIVEQRLSRRVVSVS